MHKVILVVLDGLGYQVAHDCMGFMQALVERKKGRMYRIECELPGLSRPLYETLLTGTHPLDSGITHNQVIRKSNQQSIFSLASKAGLKTAAAAYYWISELYNESPFDKIRHRYSVTPGKPVQQGIFYYADTYPDSHLFSDAEFLRQQYDPDFLLVHSMNIDDAGHHHGCNSVEYRHAAREADNLLSEYLPIWLQQDYQIIVTSDHGMNSDCTHGGVTSEEREIPLYIAGSAFQLDAEPAISQLDLCGVMCTLLGITQHGKPENRDILA
ncbi:alkaline phosphatase family protein [Spongorhabdus nitratireducens]